MKIKKIEWRNFSSYGNRTQELIFEDSALYQIVGENGAGKTTISQAIAFALYGKVEGKKLGDIPNRINGNTWVRINIESAGKDIVIERGIEPSIFNLYIDNVQYDKAGKTSVQDYLTDDLLGIPHYVFNNTISLSINDFKSFIKMNPQDKRAIIDRIFGFQILNQMRNLLKDETKRIKDDLNITIGKLDSLTETIESSSSEMENLAKSIEVNNTTQLDQLSEKLLTFKDLQKLHIKKISSFEIEYSKFTSLMRDCNKAVVENRNSISDIKRNLDLYNNDKCPTCKTELSGEFHESIKNGLLEEKDKLEKQKAKLEESYNEFTIKEKAYSLKRTDLTEKGNKIASRLLLIEGEIENLNNTSTDKQTSALEKIIKNLNENHSILSSKKFKTEEKIDWIKTMDDVIGDRGVKQMAIRTILPSLNTEILELLNDMNLPYQIIFDESFKASIYHMGIEIPNQTLSTGEMKKVDFIVLVSILKLMKLKFSSLNLLFLDELFSSVDPEGVTAILKILRKISKEMGLSVFVINHAPMPHDIFDWKLEVTKPNNFSTISIDKF